MKMFDYHHVAESHAGDGAVVTNDARAATDRLHLAHARLRLEAARDAENRASRLLPSEFPRVQITPGSAFQPPRYAYSEEEIEASHYGQFRSMPAGHVRDLIERGYRRAMAEYRLKKAEYDRECEACGHAAAERELVVAAAAFDLLTA